MLLPSKLSGHKLSSAIAHTMKRGSSVACMSQKQQKHSSCPLHITVSGNAGRTLVQVFSGESTSLGLSKGIGRHGKADPVWALLIVSKKLFTSLNPQTVRLNYSKPVWELNMKKTVENATGKTESALYCNSFNCSRVGGVCTAGDMSFFCCFLWFNGYLHHPDSLGIYPSVIQREAVVLSPKQTHLSVEHTYPG